MKVVRIVSQDMAHTQSPTDAYDISELDWFGLVEIVSVGLLIEERNDCYIIAKEYNSKNNTARQLTAIPKLMILAYNEIE